MDDVRSMRSTLARDAAAGCNTRQMQRLFRFIDLQTVGGVASHIAFLLQGKHLPSYNSAKVSGDNVIVVNAVRVVMNGHSWDTKVYKFDRKGGCVDKYKSNRLM